MHAKHKESANPHADKYNERNFFMICAPDAKTICRGLEFFGTGTQLPGSHRGNISIGHNSSTLFRIYLPLRSPEEICTNGKWRDESKRGRGSEIAILPSYFWGPRPRI